MPWQLNLLFLNDDDDDDDDILLWSSWTGLIKYVKIQKSFVTQCTY